MILQEKTVLISLLFIFGLTICQIHTWLTYFYPEMEVKVYDLWLSNSYHENLSVAWYMFELENILCSAIWFFAFYLGMKDVSSQVSGVCFIFMIYFLTQAWFYVWDRNSNDISNNIVYIYILIAVTYLIIPEKHNGKIVNF